MSLITTEFDVGRRIGIPTFLKAPISQDLENVDIGFIGVPWDGTILSYPGTRFGPREVRSQSMRINAYNGTLKVNPFKKYRLADCGDVVLNPFSIKKTVDAIYQTTSMLLEKDILPISVGGDHMISYPLMKAVREKEGELAVVQFDAHTDTYDEFYGEKFNNGSSFRRAIEQGIIIPDKLIQIGIRKLYTEQDLDFHAEHGIQVISNVQLKEEGIKVVRAAFEKLKGYKVYVTFDIDFLDPSYAPGSGSREAFGATPFEAMQCIHALKNLDIVGMDLVEVSPPNDVSDLTTWLAAQLLFEMTCIL